MFCKINRTLYCFQVRYPEKFEISIHPAVLIKGHPAYYHENVMWFKGKVPNITPQNIIDKVKTFLTFS